MDYMERYKAEQKEVCGIKLGVSTASTETKVRRIKERMSRAVQSNDKDLAQIACDLVADELPADTELLSQLDQELKANFY